MTHPGGRPCEYTPEIGAKILKCFNKGMSICAIARKFKVDRQTIYNWAEKVEEFVDIFKKGKDWSQGCWEEKGRKNLENKQFNAVLWLMNMKKRFRDEWSDSEENKSNISNEEITEDRELARRCKE